MDYNYVRMRNAEKNGDSGMSAHYKKLYEKGIVNIDNTRSLTVVICILAVIVLALGAYIVYDLISSPEIENTAFNAYMMTQGVSA